MSRPGALALPESFKIYCEQNVKLQAKVYHFSDEKNRQYSQHVKDEKAKGERLALVEDLIVETFTNVRKFALSCGLPAPSPSEVSVNAEAIKAQFAELRQKGPHASGDLPARKKKIKQLDEELCFYNDIKPEANLVAVKQIHKILADSAQDVQAGCAPLHNDSKTIVSKLRMVQGDELEIAKTVVLGLVVNTVNLLSGLMRIVARTIQQAESPDAGIDARMLVDLQNIQLRLFRRYLEALHVTPSHYPTLTYAQLAKDFPMLGENAYEYHQLSFVALWVLKGLDGAVDKMYTEVELEPFREKVCRFSGPRCQWPERNEWLRGALKDADKFYHKHKKRESFFADLQAVSGWERSEIVKIMLEQAEYFARYFDPYHSAEEKSNALLRTLRGVEADTTEEKQTKTRAKQLMAMGSLLRDMLINWTSREPDAKAKESIIAARRTIRQTITLIEKTMMATPLDKQTLEEQLSTGEASLQSVLRSGFQLLRKRLNSIDYFVYAQQRVQVPDEMKSRSREFLEADLAAQTLLQQQAMQEEEEQVKQLAALQEQQRQEEEARKQREAEEKAQAARLQQLEGQVTQLQTQVQQSETKLTSQQSEHKIRKAAIEHSVGQYNMLRDRQGVGEFKQPFVLHPALPVVPEMKDLLPVEVDEQDEEEKIAVLPPRPESPQVRAASRRVRQLSRRVETITHAQQTLQGVGEQLQAADQALLANCQAFTAAHPGNRPNPVLERLIKQTELRIAEYDVSWWRREQTQGILQAVKAHVRSERKSVVAEDPMFVAAITAAQVDGANPNVKDNYRKIFTQIYVLLKQLASTSDTGLIHTRIVFLDSLAQQLSSLVFTSPEEKSLIAGRSGFSNWWRSFAPSYYNKCETLTYLSLFTKALAQPRDAVLAAETEKAIAVRVNPGLGVA